MPQLVQRHERGRMMEDRLPLGEDTKKVVERGYTSVFWVRTPTKRRGCQGAVMRVGEIPYSRVGLNVEGEGSSRDGGTLEQAHANVWFQGRRIKSVSSDTNTACSTGRGLHRAAAAALYRIALGLLPPAGLPWC